MKIFENKRQLGTGLIIILLIINIAALSSFIIARISGEKKIEPESFSIEVEKILEEEIGFDKEQLARYASLKKQYDREAGAIRFRMQSAMTDMLKEIGDSKPDTALIRNLALKFGESQAELKLATMQHLIQLRQLSDSGQEQRLNEFYGLLHQRHRRGMGKGRGMGAGMGRGRGMGFGQQFVPGQNGSADSLRNPGN